MSLIDHHHHVLYVDKAVQTNYLAVTSDSLCGVNVFAETVLEVVGDKPQKLEWPGYGFYIEIPVGALPPGVTASVAVKVVLGSQFQFPENRQLISAIYWISTSEVLLKEVSVYIEHCAVIKNEEQCSLFKFIVASKCSQEALPYRFSERDGVFKSHNQYATIKLKQFSLLGQVAPADAEICYTAFMYYKPLINIPENADFHFVLIRNLPPHIKYVEEFYQGWSEDSNRLSIQFVDAIELDLNEIELGPWKIVPLTTSRFTKDDVADFEPGRRIPLCAFEFQLLPDRKPQRIFHKVDIIGATSQPFFYIRYYHTQSKEAGDNIPTTVPEPEAVTTQQEQGMLFEESPELHHLMSQVANKTLPKWYELGIQLKIDLPTLDAFEQQTREQSQLYLKVFDHWKKATTMPYTWTTIIDALEAVEERNVASSIRKWLSDRTRN